MPLDEVDHTLLRKANQQFSDDNGARERIVEVDDQVLFKVKVQRWRGAVWTEPTFAWLVTAGVREAGSPDDFYAALAAAGHAARARYNATRTGPRSTATFTEHLLPGEEDRRRLQAESGVRFEGRLHSIVIALVCASLRDGHEHLHDLGSFTIGLQVRADHGHETYVAVRVTGSVPLNLVGTILDMIPGCDPEAWFPELGGLPERRLRAGEVVWSNIMDPSTAAKLLEADDSRRPR